MAPRPLSIDIRDPLLLKASDVVLVTQEDGSFPLDVPGFGLFYRDTCYLGAYALRLNATEPLMLMASDAEGEAAQIELTNRRLCAADGGEIPDHKLSLRRRLKVAGAPPSFTDELILRNFSGAEVLLPLSLEFRTTFESMFVLRGTPPGRRGRLLAPEWEERRLRFSYEGADEVRRSLLVEFSEKPLIAPRTPERTVAHFELRLGAGGRGALTVTCRLDERPVSAPRPAFTDTAPPPGGRSGAAGDGAVPPTQPVAHVETASGDVRRTLERSLADLKLLEVRRGEHRFTAAGVPWFVGLFGRDSLLPSLQCLAFTPDLAADTLRSLAHWQGRMDDPRTREEPGKILHELRVGELAHLKEVTQTPSYAAVDATPLFLIALARHCEWTGEDELFAGLRPNVDAALAWLLRKLDQGGGFVTYDGVADGGQPINQSWRDSGTGVLRADGAYPEPPLALVEVQGYAFQALMLLAKLLRRTGDARRSDDLEDKAERLRRRFEEAFWMEKEGCYCLALEHSGRQVTSVTSNTAQVLWTGIAAPERAARIAERVMRADMFSGWGVRTLSSDHVAFDPLAYQQGSVWPFDNSLIVSGFRRYGQDGAALRVAAATFEAARRFRRSRLPEFIAGVQREAGDDPVHTPRADPMQAWSAGALPFILTELLGIRGEGAQRRLTVERPLLPEGVDTLSLRDLQVAGGSVSLRFTRTDEGARTEVLERRDREVLVL